MLHNKLLDVRLLSYHLLEKEENIRICNANIKPEKRTKTHYLVNKILQQIKNLFTIFSLLYFFLQFLFFKTENKKISLLLDINILIKKQESI